MRAEGSQSDYIYDVESCDVRDAEALIAFRTKRDEWLDWLHYDEHHAISNQISGMLWSDAVFRLINAARKHAHQPGGGFATQSGILAGMVDRGYVAEQVISFRKLMERGARDPKKQVISLRRLIDDVRENRDLLTREIFVCHDGLPFDAQDGWDKLPASNEGGVSFGWGETTGPRAFGMSDLMHQSFDQMMDAVPLSRGRDDRIGTTFFEKIEAVLSDAPFVDLRRFANKVLLHAADETSRENDLITGVTLDAVWKCQKAILMAANRISIAIGGTNIGAVPTPQYDVLEFWGAPFAPEASFSEMIEEWSAENDRREEWCHGLFGG